MGRNRKTLHLDREHKKFLGVCAGLANFLEVEAWTVRLVFLICSCFAAWFLVPLYFAAWFLLDDSSANARSSITDNYMVNHFKTVDYRKKMYRNTEDGKFLGVCAGIADYLEVNVFAVRIVFLVLIFLTGFPVLFYFGAALVLDKKPPRDPFSDRIRTDTSGFADEAERVHRPGMEEGLNAARAARMARNEFSGRREFQYCARKFATLQSRLARLEAYVTSSRFKLHREFRNIS